MSKAEGLVNAGPGETSALSGAPHRFAFVVEQTLGHVTHMQNLRACVTGDRSVSPIWVPVEYGQHDLVARLPLVRSNWTLQLSLRARAALSRAIGSSNVDAILFHTQITAHTAFGRLRRVPTVVSMDATPINRRQVDEVAGVASSAGPALRGLKRAWTSRTLRRAAAVIAWSQWAARSAIDDYGAEPQRVKVIPPGVDLQLWRPVARSDDSARPLRLLFVGGDFARKGGPLLLSALSKHLGHGVELDIVTQDESVASTAGVRVHRGLKPNTPQLRQMFDGADALILPTHKDYTPLVVIEAMASGLPVVATDVGAIREQVQHNVTGLLVQRGDGAALTAAVEALGDARRRQAMGTAGRALAERSFCATRNSAALLTVMKLASSRANARDAAVAAERRPQLEHQRSPASVTGAPARGTGASAPSLP